MAKVLIVDDSRLARAMLRGIISGQGHEVVGEAEDAPQSLVSFKALSPDVVTLDLILPSGSGIDVLKEMRQINDRAKVIVVTASGQDSLDKQVLALGAHAVLHKPFTPEEFTTVLEQALQ